MAKKKPQPIRGSRKFQGTDSLSANDLKRLNVTTFDGAADKFLENWNREPVFMVGLTLTLDNTKIESATPLLQGDFWPEGKEFDASTFWTLQKSDLLLCFNKIDLAKFEFEDVITSKLLDHTHLDYSIKYKSDNSIVNPDDLKAWGYPGFCLRAFCHPISTTSVKVAMLLYPLERETLMKEHNLAPHYYFPGVTAERVEIELGIQRDELLDNNYGCPILPVVRSREPIRSNSKVPSRQEIVYAIGSLLRATRAPDAKSSHSTLLKAWGQLKKHGESKLKKPVYDWEWIKPPVPAPQTGTHL